MLKMLSLITNLIKLLCSVLMDNVKRVGSPLLLIAIFVCDKKETDAVLLLVDVVTEFDWLARGMRRAASLS